MYWSFEVKKLTVTANSGKWLKANSAIYILTQSMVPP